MTDPTPDTTASVNHADPGQPARPRRGRKLLLAVAGLVVIVLLLVLLLPTLVSSGPGTRLVTSIANGSINGTLAIDDLSVGWFSATRVRGLSITGDDGDTIVTVNEIALPDKSLLALIRDTQHLGRITGDTIDVHLVRYDDGTTNLQRLVPPADETKKPKTKKHPKADDAGTALHADVQLASVNLALTSPGVEPVRVEASKLNAKLDGLKQLDLDIDATVTQGDHAGKLTATGGISDFAGPAPRADLAAQIATMPVAALDHLLGYEGKLVALLGDQLDAQLDIAGSQTDATLKLTANSPRLSADLPLQLTSEELTGDKGAHVLLTVTPAGYAAWATGGGELLEPVTVRVELNELHLPMADGAPLTDKLRTVVLLSADAMKLRHAQVGDVAMASLDGHVAIDLGVGSINAKLAGPFTLNEQPGELDLAATVVGIGSEQGYEIDATLADLPVPIVDQLAQQDGRVVALLGQRLTLKAQGAYPGDLDVMLTSDHVTLNAPLSITDDMYALRGPARAELRLQPSAYPVIVGEHGGTLLEPATITLSVSAARVPIFDDKPDPAHLHAEAAVAATPIRLDVPDVGRIDLAKLAGTLVADRSNDRATLTLRSPLSINDLQGDLDLDAAIEGLTSDTRKLRVAMVNLPVPVVDQLAGQNGRAVALLGNRMKLQIDGSYPGDLDIAAQSDRLQLTAPVSITDTAYALRGPASLKLTLEPAGYAKLVGESAGTLAQTTTIDLAIKEARLPLVDGKPDVAQLRADATLDATPIDLDVPSVGRVQLAKLAGKVTADRTADAVSLMLTSPMDINGQTGALDATARVTGLAATTRTIDIALNDVPTPIVDQLANQNGKVVALLGATMTVTAKGSYPGDLDVGLKSPDAQLTAPLAFSETSWSLRSPGKLTLKVTPSDYATLLGEGAGTLKQPFTLSADVTAFAVPLVDNKPDWTKLKAALAANAGTITLNMPQLGDTVVEKLTVAVNTDRSTDTAQVTAKSPVSVAGEPGNLDVALTLKSTADGPPYDIAGTITDLPMPLVDHLAKLNGDATALVGPTATAKVAGVYPGALQFDMDSRSVKAVAPIHIADTGVVTLTNDINVQVNLEDDGTRRIMARLHPIIADAAKSEQPIRLLVRTQGFEMPTKDFTFDKLRAKGTLDLGKLQMTRKGWFDSFLAKALSKLKLGGIVEAETYTASFTPAQFVVVNGQVRTSEFWMTSDEMAVGFQGKADVPGDAYDFKLGIMGSTLISKLKEIPGVGKDAYFMPADEIITVPLAGKLNQPVPDPWPLSTALAKFAAAHYGSDGDDVSKYVDLGSSVLGGLFGGGGSKSDAAPAKWAPPQVALDVAKSMQPPPEEKPAPKPKPKVAPAEGEAAASSGAADSAAAREQAEQDAAQQRKEAAQRRKQAEKEAAQQRAEAEARRKAQQEKAEQRRREAEQAQ